MKTVLITGIRGFVGPYLKRELEDYGYSVFGIGCEKSKEDNYYCTDITNKHLLKTTIDAIMPDFVFHLAGVNSTQLAKSNPNSAFNVNIEGTRNLLEVLVAYPGTRTLIVSSSHVYGRPEKLPVDESHPLNGKGPYAESRIKQEAIIKSFVDSCKVVVTRSFNHTGPYQNDAFVIPKIVSQIVAIKKGKREFLEVGDIDVKRDILDVRDVVKAYVLLLEQNKFGITCNVCRGKSISLSKVIEETKQLAGIKDIKIQINPEFVKEDDVRDIYGDNSFLREIIDWRPTIKHEKMIQDIYKYWNKEIT